MKLEVKQMYGLNGKGNFELDSDKKHNFIYGINASGKSSIASSLIHLLNKTVYNKRFPYDSDDYYVRLKFDDINIEYRKSVDISKIPNINRRVFVFNKTFIKDSLALETTEGQGTTPEIGIRIAERNSLINSNNSMVEDNIKAIKKNLKESELPTTQKELFDGSSFKIILGKDVYAQQEVLLDLYKLKEKETLLQLNKKDFFAESITAFNMFKTSISQLTEEIINRMKEKIKSSKYKINSKEEKNFYLSVIEYLKGYSGIIDCPVCLSTKIDTEKLKKEIEEVLKGIINDAVIKDISNSYEKVKNLSSYFSNLIDSIYESIMQCKFPSELILDYTNNLNSFTKNYDLYIISFANIDISKDFVKSIGNNNKLISEINDSNKQIANSVFVEQFDKMLDYIFQDDEIRAKSSFTDNSITIQLSIKGKEKEEKSIGDFFDIISESQKTKLSLAFFLALVVYKDESNNILCVFDDPIDSYDSISKYRMARILYEFINKKNFFENYFYDCFSVFLSHSVEYFRLFIYNFRDSDRDKNNYYILSNGGLSSIDYNNLFVIEGDYNILNNLVHDRKSGKISINELISIIPIIRELASYSDKNFKLSTANLNVNNNEISDINAYLSDNVIHGFDINIKLKDLIATLKKYITIDVEMHMFSDDELIFDVIKSLIVSNRNIKLNFYDEIVLKNLIAIYIRAFYDSTLIKIVKNYVQKYNSRTIQELKSNKDLWTINNKITAINKDSTAWNNYKDICMAIAVDLTMLNDFAHSAGIYLTPLIDVKLSDLYSMFDKINANNSIFEPIKQIAYV